MAAVSMDESASFSHVPVMVRQVVDLLAPRPHALYLDMTAGGGGHARAILEAAPDTRILAFDRDPAAVAAAQGELSEFGARAEVVHASFEEAAEELARRNVTGVAGLIADLGLSSAQLDDPGRGMSFRHEGPLDMRMDPSRGETAYDLIERLSQDQLADVIYQLGEERRSRRVARCIKQALATGELRSTFDLRRSVVRAVGPRRIGGVDPATRTFQALRMAVNRELDQLRTVIDLAYEIVEPNGVAVFISFHSLEDRLVKRAFADSSAWQRLTPKPIVASEAEQTDNPRSRSAKLRAARRLLPSEVPEA
jgi:16S rRNA (cytosine1402-N4)-methyltransferase